MKLNKFIKIILIIFMVNIVMFFACSYALATIDIYRPTAIIDYVGKTTFPDQAYDNDNNSAADVLVDMDASPSITYHSFALSPPTPEYDSLTLYVEREAVDFVDDKWIIRYSTDAGISWQSMHRWTSNINKSIFAADVDPSLDLGELIVRIDTDKKKKVDFGHLHIYEIWVEGEVFDEPSFTQSAYRFFNNIDSLDVSAIVSGVNGADEAMAIALHDNYIITAGYRLGDWYVDKRNKGDGSLACPGCSVAVDDSWGEVKAIAIDGTHVFLVGVDFREGNNSWRIEKRSLLDLELDGGFGDGGVVISNPSDDGDTAYAAAIFDGSILVVGSDSYHGQSDTQWRMEKRSLADGHLEAVATVNPSPYKDKPFAIAIDDTYTYAYVVGYDSNTNPAAASKPGKAKKITPDEQWRIEKWQLSDLSSVGHVNSDRAPGKTDIANDIAIDDTHMYVIGYECDPEYYFDPMWRIERRLLGDLTFAPGLPPEYPQTEDGIFGEDGAIRQNYAPGRDDQPTAIAIDASSCEFYIVGYSGEPENGAQWRYEIRDCDTGSLVLPAVVNDIDPYYNDRAYAVAIDGTDVYAAGYYNPGVPDLRIAKRNRSDLLPSFQQPLYPVNSAITIEDGKAFRLRILLHVDDGPLLQNGQQFKLQCGVKSGDCSNATYADVNNGTPIIFYDNPTPLGGSALIGNLEDPSHGSPPDPDPHTIYEQTYEEQNGFTNSVSTVDAGSDGMWDFSLQAGIAGSGTYCIRIVEGDGTSLTGYLEYPEVTISP